MKIERSNYLKITFENKFEKNFIESLTKYNKLLKNRYLSPGGSADILSLAIFWLIIEEQIILPLK